MYGKTSFGASAQPKIIVTKIPTTYRFVFLVRGNIWFRETRATKY